MFAFLFVDTHILLTCSRDNLQKHITTYKVTSHSHFPLLISHSFVIFFCRYFSLLLLADEK